MACWKTTNIANRGIVMATSLGSGTYQADNANLSGSVFRNVNLSGSKFDDVNLRGVEFHNVALTGGSIKDACLGDFTIEDSSYEGMRIEGILVTDLLQVYREQCKAASQS
jgi:uncharacterized protein YjbI with pentapeptide repeats